MAHAICAPSVQDIHERDRKDIGLLGAGKIRDVRVQGDALFCHLSVAIFDGQHTIKCRKMPESHLLCSAGLGNSQADAEDGVRAELGLVRGAIELDEQLVNGRLVLDIDARLNELRAEDRVDVLDGLENALAAPLALVSVAKLASLVLA